MLLAIDQGSRRCGWALFYKDKKLHSSGVFTMKGTNRRLRYIKLLDYLRPYFTNYDIDVLAIEDIYLKRSRYQNPKVLGIMGETRGIIISLALNYTENVIDINPSEVSKFLNIRSDGDKKLFTQMYVRDLIKEVPEEDQADAVIIGLIALDKEGV